MKNPTHSAFVLAHQALCSELSSENLNISYYKRRAAKAWEDCDPHNSNDENVQLAFSEHKLFRHYARLAEDRKARLEAAISLMKSYIPDVNHVDLQVGSK